AVARLYERYAELLPDGPARARAAATARVVMGRISVTGTMPSPFDLDRYAATCAPAVEAVDHRVLGTWTASGVQAVREHVRSLLDVADRITRRVHAILDLRPDAFLLHQTNVGIARAGGGVWERSFLWLLTFGPDGRVT